MSSYEFPEVFVKGVSGDYYIVLESGVYRFSKQPCGEEFYGHIVYEDVIDKAVDLVEAVVVKDFIVIPRYRAKGDLDALHIPSNTRLCIMEVKSLHPYVFVDEGDFVGKGDRIAYMVTGKGEVRVYKSLCSGIVVLVVNITWERPERYIIVVVGESDVRRITVKRG